MIYAGYSPKKSSDEQYTPAYAVAPIVKYIPKNKTVWCPFDTEHSEFVLAMRDAGIKVVHSHILTGEDFFSYEPEKWDMIVSNPPFSIKQKVVERCLAAVQPVDQQQRTCTALCRKGDADTPVRQAHPVHREERRLFRFELFLPQGAAPSDRVRESGKVTVREKPHERGYGKNDRTAVETQDMNREQK